MTDAPQGKSGKPATRLEHQPKRESPQKPSRGRPEGSGRFEETDQKVLIALAERCVREPATVPTKVFRSLGYEGRSELARLSSKWRKRKHILIAEAKQRLEATRQLSPFGEFVASLSSFGLHLDAWAASPTGRAFLGEAQRLGQSFGHGQAAAVARHMLDDASSSFAETNASSSPDAEDASGTASGNKEEELAACREQARAEGSAERFKNRTYKTMSDLGPSFDPSHTMDDLPPSQKFYALALLYHEMALDAERREQSEAGKSESSQEGMHRSDDRPSSNQSADNPEGEA